MQTKRIMMTLVAAASMATAGGLAHAQFQPDYHAPQSKAAKRSKAHRPAQKARAGQRISARQAASIAARHHRGRAVKVELDRERGRLVYEVDVVSGRREYDVKVDAYTGRIISSKLDDVDYDYDD